jgi:ferritin-like metal-binding protein YciE
MAETTSDVIRRYLEDAIAAEKSFETQLQGFAKEGDDPRAQSLFQLHATETRNQYERLTGRLEELGGSTSATKSMLAHLFNLSPKAAQIGHEKEERTTQNLILAFAVENSECAMYESLATIAAAAGDTETATLARSIQTQERATAEKIWALIPSVAAIALGRVTGATTTANTAATAP